MANIFKQNLDITQHPNRNNHDLTHKVHGTYKFGKLYPFLCKPVVPSDSFRIDTACGFQFMPMPFPTQSNIRVVFHYFYVRNKNLWSNWENWLQGLEEHTPPFINQPASFYKTGSLADFLDIPTTLAIVGTNDATDKNDVAFFNSSDVSHTGLYVVQLSNYLSSIYYTLQSLATNNIIIHDISTVENSDVKNNINSVWFPHALSAGFDSLVNYEVVLNMQGNTPPQGLVIENSACIRLMTSRNYSNLSVYLNDEEASLHDDFLIHNKDYQFSDYHERATSVLLRGLPDEFAKDVSDLQSQGYNVFPIFIWRAGGTTYAAQFPRTTASLVNSRSILNYSDVYDLPVVSASNPYYSTSNSGDDTIKISALPFRAYESIYRCYYANSVIQPLEINGEKKYNRYNTNLDDGADDTDYHLFNRNWELDAYTSCLPSPQQGNAPLVGMNVLGQVTIQDPDTGAVTTADTQVDGEDVSLVVTSPIQSVEHGRTLVNLLNTGISIADLRQTNNLTRFLEQSIRSGYRYVDFIKGQFGNEPKYAELDMPEFLGGFSQRVDVNTISNTNGDLAVDSDVKLGSYAGQARAFGGSEHGITRYFDDYGWIVGIMCIVPDAAYSQLLPKHFTFNNRLDYYFPLFSEIGLQPITYEEVSPVQSHNDFVNGDTSKKLTDTFGYQRPNHDLVWFPDTVHGQMRLSLKDTLINRVFAHRPELGNDFLTIKPEETNNIFSVTEADNDVVIGQIVVKITAKRPVPRIVIPGLGR